MKNKKLMSPVWILFAVAAYTCQGQAILPVPVNRIDSLFQKAMAMDLFSGNVLVVHNQVIAYEKSFGMADYDNHIPNTADNKFQLASITKDFTRVMVLQLAEQHKLSLSGTIGQYLPGFSDEVSRVTVVQLLNFTSGLGDYHTSAEFQQMQGKTLVISDLLPVIRKEKLQFEPGTRVLYSNSGYVVLGAIIEKVTGKNYYEDLKELILSRLNMTNTAINGYLPALPGMATGYLSNQPGPLTDNRRFHFAGGGDGGIYTTTHDLLAFILSVFYDNRLLSDSSKLIFVSGMPGPVKFKSWAEFRKSGRYSPAGGAPGASTLYTVNMGTQNVAIILSNFDEGTAEELGTRLSAILNGRSLVPLHQPASKYLYTVIKTKGGAYFMENYRQEVENSEMNPGDDMVLLNVGTKLSEEKDYDNAIDLFTVYTREFPGIIIAWNELGELYLAKGDRQNAGRCFSAALRLSPDNQRAKRGLENSK
jgi:CubicO group peptidase (beta-lactamase class C family)